MASAKLLIFLSRIADTVDSSVYQELRILPFKTLSQSEYWKLTEGTPQYHHLPKFQRVLRESDQRNDGKAALLQEKALVESLLETLEILDDRARLPLPNLNPAFHHQFPTLEVVPE